MTIVTHGDDDTIEQITKQLHKLIDVITVKDHQRGERSWVASSRC